MRTVDNYLVKDLKSAEDTLHKYHDTDMVATAHPVGDGTYRIIVKKI